ncbi:hypothetical protein AGMMS49975_00610 [Clostridia bacterium]|nr:hypothetical protein AGMMS49975_00610 [Clostridia bacterium]
MRFFAVSFWINFKRILFSPLFVSAAFVLFATLFIMSKTIHNDILTVNIGFFAENNNSAGNKIADTLARNDIGVTLSKFDDKEHMIKLVKQRKLECAYVVKDTADLDGILEVIRTEYSAATPLINEMAFAAVLKAFAAEISAKTTADALHADYGVLLPKFTESIQTYYANDIFLSPEFIPQNAPEKNADIWNLRLFHGVWLTILFVLSYFLIPVFAEGKNRTAFFRQNAYLYHIGQYAASVIALMLLNLCALLILYKFTSGVIVNLRMEFFGILVYTLCTQLIAQIFAVILPNGEILFSWFIFILVFQVLFGNVFFDLSEVWADFKVLPSSYYMDFLLHGGF